MARTKKTTATSDEFVGFKTLSAESRMDALRKTAQIISENFGIDVVFKGDQAYTNGRTIFVPSLAEDASEDIITAIIGYIDHEVGHIRHTDFSDRRMFLDKDPRASMATNVVEDIRQERLMAEEYRGVGLNLERAHNWTMTKISDKWDEIDAHNQMLLLAMARSKVLQDWRGYSEFLDKHEGAFAPILDALMDEIKTWHMLPNTSAAYEAAKRFLAKLDALSAPPPALPSPPAGSGGKGSPAPKSKGRDHKEDDEIDKIAEEGEDGSPSEDETPAEGSSAAAGGSGGSDDEDEGESEGSSAGEGDEDSEDEDAEDGAGGEAEAEDEEAAPPELPAETKELLGSLSSDKATGKSAGIHEEMAGAITDVASGSGGHRAYTLEFDRSVPPAGEGKLEDYSKALEEIRPHVNTVYTVLTRTLIAEGRARTTFGLTEGRLATSSLSKLRVGDPTVFKKKRKGRTLNTYVEIIIDQSGSMGGTKIRLAMETCMVLAEALERVGVSYGIVGFTCGWHPYGIDDPNLKARSSLAYSEAHGSKGDGFARTEPLIEYVYKRPDDSLAKCRPTLSLMEDQYMYNNADGDSIMRIAKRVAQSRKEARKILIVLSDGQPCAASGDGVPYEVHKVYMKKVAKLIKNTPGMEVIGIGINSDAVKTYYSRAVVVREIAELPSIAIGELKTALMGH